MTAIQERPVAWAVNHAHGTTVWDSETKARKVADEWLASGVWIWAEVVPLYRQPRWIPVSERLPDDRQQVIACFPSPLEFVTHAVYEKDPGWFSIPHYGAAQATHWMPLPEPPEMK